MTLKKIAAISIFCFREPKNDNNRNDFTFISFFKKCYSFGLLKKMKKGEEKSDQNSVVLTQTKREKKKSSLLGG